ncbi:hypothetical protein ACQV5M_20715, partial [Leptospira sp. SA-E8]
MSSRLSRLWLTYAPLTLAVMAAGLVFYFSAFSPLGLACGLLFLGLAAWSFHRQQRLTRAAQQAIVSHLESLQRLGAE